MSFVRTACATLLLAASQTASGQLGGEAAASGCIDVSGAQARVSATGLLVRRTFPGPPNYASIAEGDEEERTFILELPETACIEDGNEFADPRERVATVHVSARDAALMKALGTAAGRRVTVSGAGFAAHTGHHHAPLVVLADIIAMHGAVAGRAGAAAAAGTDLVAITDVAPEPGFTSGVLAVVVRVEGRTGRGARTYYIPFFETGQTMPRVGETCAVVWHLLSRYSVIADAGSVTEGRMVSSFRCGRRSWSG